MREFQDDPDDEQATLTKNGWDMVDEIEGCIQAGYGLEEICSRFALSHLQLAMLLQIAHAERDALEQELRNDLS